jgi:CHAT domain-containing protein
LQAYGDAQNRAGFFGQFTDGFDYYVERCVADGDLTAALAGNMRLRSRSLLEQMQLAVDPREGLTGPENTRLLRREEELKHQVSVMRAKTWSALLGSAPVAEREKLGREFDIVRQQYAEVWREILNASPVYRNLADPRLGGPTLEALRADLVGAGNILLVYHLGKKRSFLFVVGKTTSAFELTVPEEVARESTTPPALTTSEALSGARGLALRALPQPKEPPLTLAESRQARRMALGSEVARILVDHYRLQIADPAFAPVRGLGLRSRDAARPLRVQRADLLGEVFLPLAAREQIRTEAPQEVLVIPDGALHKLPLEAVILEAGAQPRYVLDELPPLTYAPSLSIVRLLLERTRGQRPQLDSLLTVSNPAYPTKADLSTGAVGPHIVLPPLPFSAIEAQKIRPFFEPRRVTALEGSKATERSVVAHLPGARVVHLAAHGFADDQFGNLFGALALTPGAAGESTDDGFLSLHEIYTLPLRDCELAVLSACVTNVGPQPPLEAGMTIASGFLAAGVQRVVASHWHVHDQATAELMEVFFAKLTEATRQGRSLAFARALQEGRLHLRRQEGRAAPFYWAPFVLIGPPEAKAR